MAVREGNLQAPKREPIDWQAPEFTDGDAVDEELARVFDVCHTCRRCVNLCNAFPTLFDLIDDSPTFEVDGVDKADFRKVTDACYLCDICAETKCPYLPPHQFAVDFPHLMLRAKARYLNESKSPWHTRLLTSTESLFSLAAQPGIASMANAALESNRLRQLGEKTAQIHADAPIPKFHASTAKRRLLDDYPGDAVEAGRTTGKVAIYVTCYGDAFDPLTVEALVKVLTHNGIRVKVLKEAHCCGMPKLELGDIETVVKNYERNRAVFLEAVADGFDLMSIVPSCTLMYRQEMPLLLPTDEDVKTVSAHFFDPFEYLWLRHQADLLELNFKQSLGNVTYHAACHQRVQNFGRRTQDILSLIPETDVAIIERCSGHGGTYAIRKLTYESAMKIGRPASRAVQDAKPDTFGSDCPIAGRLIAHGINGEQTVEHPIQMLARAYGLT